MATMSSGEAMVKSLVREGVELAFGIGGIHTSGILVALRDEPDIRLITTRHEQGAACMADSYSRVSGKPGVALVVPGVGLFNAGGGMGRSGGEAALVELAEATNIPVILSGGGKGAVPDNRPLSYGSCVSPAGEGTSLCRAPGSMPTSERSPGPNPRRA